MKKLITKLLCLFVLFTAVCAPINADTNNQPTDIVPTQKNDPTVTPKIAPCTFIITSHKEEWGEKFRVSFWADGPRTVAAEFSQTITESFSASGSLSFTAGMKAGFIAQVEAKYGVTWNHTTASEVSETITEFVPEGKTGAMAFIPLYQVYSGIFYDENLVPHNVTGRMNKKLGNYADGRFTVMFLNN